MRVHGEQFRPLQDGPSPERIAAALARSNDLVTCVDAEARVTLWNAGCELLYGWTAQEVLGRPLRLFIPPEEHERLGVLLRALEAGEQVPPVEMVRSTKSGQRVHVSLRISPLLDDDGRYAGGLAVGRDITLEFSQRQQAAQASARRQVLARHVCDVGLLAQADGTIVLVTESAGPQLGHHPDRLLGRLVWELWHPEDLSLAQAAWAGVLHGAAEQGRVQTRVRRGDGDWTWVEQTLTNHLDSDGVGAVVVILRDVSELKAGLARLHQNALYDELTGVANRVLLLDRAGHALERAVGSGSRVGMLCIGLDALATVNDRLGHPAGDEAVLAVAQLLGAGLEPGETLARTGGDQFVVLVDDVADEEQLLPKAAMMQALLSAGVGQREKSVELGISVGIAVRSGGQPETLLVAAQTALRAGQARGRGQIAAFSQFERLPERQHREEVDDLRRGIAAGELVLRFQPIVDLHSGRSVAAEALARWQHPRRGLLLPAEFLDVAEQSGLVLPLGYAVLRQGCEAAARWPLRDGARPQLVVNLSRRQLSDPDLAAVVAQTMGQVGLQPADLAIDVTESVLAHPSEVVAAQLRSLRDLGVSVAVDDFGTDDSSRTYVRQLPVGALKVDASHVARIADDADAAAIVSSTIRLASAAGLACVAEGVETPHQHELLRSMGCQFGQGSRWSEPLPGDQLLVWWEERGEDLPTVDRLPEPVEARTAPPRVATPQIPSDVAARLLQMESEGASLHTTAAALNAEGVLSPVGIRWHARSVARALAQLGGAARR